MLPERQTAFAARAERLANVHTITFEARLEHLMARARGIVAMGGYNTFCEILCFDKPALIVQSTTPRLEQVMLAQPPAGVGLAAVIPDRDHLGPPNIAPALVE